MGREYSVKGFRPATNETYLKMKAVVDSCTAASIEIPDQVYQWFNSQGADADDPETALEVDIPVQEQNANGRHTYNVRLADLPEGIERVEFRISY